MNIKDQFNLVSKEYDSARRIFIPCFESFYEKSTDFLASLNLNPKRILDLGAGTGLLDVFFLKHFSYAKYLLVDVADKMLDVAKKRFSGFENISYDVNDYSLNYNYKDYDMVISALSIHHLEHETKQNLFEKIYENLPSGGVFVNYDQFCYDNSELSKKADAFWCKKIENSTLSEDDIQKWKERWKLDRELSVKQEIQMLEKAGFKKVECIFYELKFGVIIGFKD